MKLIKAEAKNLWTQWDHFWFRSNNEGSLYSLALFRILFYAVMLFFYITRAPDVGFFYGEDGIYPSAYAQTLDFFKYRPSIFFHIHSLFWLNTIHTILLVALLFAMLGLFTRASSILAFFLHLMFINRNMSAIFGVDMIGTYFLLYLCFVTSNAHWSLDRKLFKKRAEKSSTLNFIFYRFLQLQPCIIYGYSGLEKLKGTRWWNGSALWDVFSMGSMQRWDFSFVSHVPLLLGLVVYGVLLWEIYFPVLIWNPKLKNYVLFGGVMLHLGIGLFMNLPSFGALMIAIYALFLTKDECRAIVRLVETRLLKGQTA